MQVRVVTAMWGTAFERYGEAFLVAFRKHWPANTDLVIISDRELPIEPARRIALQGIPGVPDFKRQWGMSAVANGYNRPAGSKTNTAGYAWRYDAVKWMPQAVSPLAASVGMSEGILVWFDADVITNSPVNDRWLGEIMGDADIAYLGREPKHSEIGFMGFRLPAAQPVIDLFAKLYTSGAVFDLEEWHSAFVFDVARKRAGASLRQVNLTPGGRGHVWAESPLGKHTSHFKGERKDTIVRGV